MDDCILSGSKPRSFSMICTQPNHVGMQTDHFVVTRHFCRVASFAAWTTRSVDDNKQLTMIVHAYLISNLPGIHSSGHQIL